MKKSHNNEQLKEENPKFHINIDWGRQGSVILAYAIVLLGYYGFIANLVMIDIYGHWISFDEMDRDILIWPYLIYFENYNDYRNIIKILPIILLFLISFLLTYKEDIPHYGIKVSIWLIPFIVAEGFMFYFFMFGISAEPFILQFLYLEGYVNLLFLYGNVLIGAISGMYLKRFITRKFKV